MPMLAIFPLITSSHSMFPGPNEVTRTFGSIWLNHVPESEFHVFQRGGYFAKEIIPNALAVLSLNTLYFYDSNKAVDGCKRYKRKTPEKDRDPGSVQLVSGRRFRKVVEDLLTKLFLAGRTGSKSKSHNTDQEACKCN